MTGSVWRGSQPPVFGVEETSGGSAVRRTRENLASNAASSSLRRRWGRPRQNSTPLVYLPLSAAFAGIVVFKKINHGWYRVVGDESAEVDLACHFDASRGFVDLPVSQVNSKAATVTITHTQTRSFVCLRRLCTRLACMQRIVHAATGRC